jgi:pimeloyl-ACP methyl ester carboxylesterase
MIPPETDIAHGYADLGDVRLHYVEVGAGPLVVLLHGFPEYHGAWRHQWGALAAAGFRVVAPDMRGYNLSSKPRRVRAYDVDYLARDVARLIRHCGEERAAAVVGHDWGGDVAWAFGMRYPAMAERLAILNVPHPVRMLQGLRTLRQLRKSWYIFFFQVPWLPEASLRANDFAAIRLPFRRDPVRPGAVDAAEIDRLVGAMAQPGALTATINYYRAFIRKGLREGLRPLRRIDCPVLVIWGEQDRYLGAELADPPRRWVPRARIVRLPDASHFVQNDRPEEVNALLLEFLRASGDAAYLGAAS